MYYLYSFENYLKFIKRISVLNKGKLCVGFVRIAEEIQWSIYRISKITLSFPMQSGYKRELRSTKP